MLRTLDKPLVDYDDDIDPAERNHKLLLQAEILRAKVDIPRLKRKLRRRARRQAILSRLFWFAQPPAD